jgi:hypothetical protein
LCLFVLPTGCGPPAATPEAMREAAAGCGIATWAVAATGDAAQSKYALHFDSAEADIDTKLDCYERTVRSMGMETTLAMGRAGFDPRTDDALLFARVREACDLPDTTSITKQDDGLMIYGASDLPPRARACASRRLGDVRRFNSVRFSDDPPPPPPRLNL